MANRPRSEARAAPFGAGPVVPLWGFPLAGVVAAFGQAPFCIPMAYVVGMAALFVAAQRSARPVLGGWLWGVGYAAVALSWITEPFLVDAETYGWMAPFGLGLMAAGFGLFTAFGIWAGRWLGAGGGGLARALGLAAGLAVAASLRAFAFTGFPWVDAGQALLDTPFALLLPWGGPRLVTLMLLAVVAVIVGTQAAGRAMGAALALGALLWGAPGSPPGPVAQTDAPVIRLVQPNAPQDQKWDPLYIPTFFERQLRFSEAQPKADLVVWPEMALPWALESGDPVFDRMRFAAGAPVVAGLPQLGDGARYYNRLVVLGQGGTVHASYAKRHLVPFGEYMPFGSLLARLGLHGLAVEEGGGYSRGAGPAVIDLPGIGAARALICYEGIFAEELRSGQRPRLLLLITNDAWFGNRIGPYQHLRQARMRALEQGVPMVRVANTGVSAMIDARGHIMESLPLNVTGSLDAKLPPALPPTLYARLGEWPAALLLVLLVIGIRGRRWIA